MKTPRSTLTGAAIGALALTGSLFGLGSIAAAEDAPQPAEAVAVVEADSLGNDVEIVELSDSDLANEVYLGDTEGPSEVATHQASIESDAVVVDIADGDVVEHVLD